MKTKRIYLDHAATTPVDPQVKRAMEPYWVHTFGNPSALSAEGAAAKKALAEARARVARALEARADEIVFTSGGTEANTLAIFGAIVWRQKLFGVPRKRFLPYIPHIITTAIEHSSVLEPVRELVRQGRAEASFVSVERNGIVRPEKIIEALRKNTMLVSIQYANNEIGTIQPIRTISHLLKTANTARPLFHVDACQAPLYLHCFVNALGVDMLSLDGHKIYGPKGVGCLYVRRKTPLAPLLVGGGQERGMRATTENVPALVGFAEALRLAGMRREKESARLASLRDYFYSSILQNTEMEICVNGSMEQGKRLPHNLNISFPGVDTEMLLFELDAAGIACSTKSSCLYDERESYVVKALAGDSRAARSTLRFTLGRKTTKKDIRSTLAALARLLRRKR